MMIDIIPYVDNLVNPFSKTLIGRVFASHMDSIGFR